MSEEKKTVVVDVNDILSRLKSDAIKFYISHENPKDIKGSTQYQSMFVEAKTNKPLHGGDCIIKAKGVSMKNGPYYEKGKKVPRSVLKAQSDGKSTFKESVTFGTKTSGPLGELMDYLFGGDIYKNAVNDLCKRIGIDPSSSENVIVPFSGIKTTYGSKKNPGDPAKKKKYMDAADWNYTFTLRGNATNYGTFGFEVYAFERSGNDIDMKKIYITAMNMGQWFRRGHTAIIMFEPGMVTLITESPVHKFYPSFDAKTYYIKPETRSVTYHHGLDESEMAAMVGTMPGGGASGANDYNSAGDDDDGNASVVSSGPATADDIEAQMAKLST